MRRRAARGAEPTESQSQAAVIAWWDLACKKYGLPPYALFSIPNGANKSMAARMKFKREGLRAGVPDLFLADARGIFKGGLWIEMKRRGGRVSEDQKVMLDYLRRAGYKTAISFGADEAIKAIKEYLA